MRRTTNRTWLSGGLLAAALIVVSLAALEHGAATANWQANDQPLADVDARRLTTTPVSRQWVTQEQALKVVETAIGRSTRQCPGDDVVVELLAAKLIVGGDQVVAYARASSLPFDYRLLQRDYAATARAVTATPEAYATFVGAVSPNRVLGVAPPNPAPGAATPTVAPPTSFAFDVPPGGGLGIQQLPYAPDAIWALLVRSTVSVDSGVGVGDSRPWLLAPTVWIIEARAGSYISVFTNLSDANFQEFGVDRASLPPFVAPPRVTRIQNPDPVPTVDFAPVDIYPIGKGARAVELADLDGDGKLDLVVGADALALFVAPGLGDGRFGSVVSYTTGIQVDALAIADLNRDGRLDVVVRSPAGWAAILLALADGGFDQPTLLKLPFTGASADRPRYTLPPRDPAIVSTSRVVVGDFNGDGWPDIAATNGGDGVTVFNGEGGGVFGSPTSYFAGSDAQGLEIGDLNRDGIPDLVFASVNLGLTPLLGQRGGPMIAGPAIAPPFDIASYRALPYRYDSLAVGDFNGDGVIDVTMAGDRCFSQATWLGRRDGSFGDPLWLRTYGSGANLHAVDLDGDGKLDIVAVRGRQITIARGVGDGSFQPSNYGELEASLAAVAHGDLNGDGRPDLAIVGPEPGQVMVALTRGLGQVAPTPTPSPAPTPVGGVVATPRPASGPINIGLPPNAAPLWQPAYPGTPTPAPTPMANSNPSVLTTSDIVRRWHERANAFFGAYAWRLRVSHATLTANGERTPGIEQRGYSGAKVQLFESTTLAKQRPGDRFSMLTRSRFDLGQETAWLNGDSSTIYRPWRNEALHERATSDSIDWNRISMQSGFYHMTPCLMSLESRISALPAGYHPYWFEGVTERDGRRLAVLAVRADADVSVCGKRPLKGSRVYVDLATYLPYRFEAPELNGARDDVKIELTFEEFTSDPTGRLAADDDFTVDLPDDVVHAPSFGVINGSEMSDQLPPPQFLTLPEAAAAVDYPVLWPPNVRSGSSTQYFVVQRGRAFPIIVAHAGRDAAWLSILQGRYPAGYEPELYPPISAPDLTVTETTIDGNRALFAAAPGSPIARLMVFRADTVIQLIMEGDKEKLLETYRLLEPINPARVR